MPQTLYLSAALLSFVWLLVHLFLGGRDIVAPFWGARQMAPTVRNTMYLCWHMTSAAILAIAVFLGLAGLVQDDSFAVAGVLLAAGFTLVGVGLQVALRQRFSALPQGWLFLPVVVLGGLGLWQ